MISQLDRVNQNPLSQTRVSECLDFGIRAHCGGMPGLSRDPVALTYSSLQYLKCAQLLMRFACKSTVLQHDS